MWLSSTEEHAVRVLYACFTAQLHNALGLGLRGGCSDFGWTITFQSKLLQKILELTFSSKKFTDITTIEWHICLSCKTIIQIIYIRLLPIRSHFPMPSGAFIHYKYKQQKFTKEQQIYDLIIVSSLVQVLRHSDNTGRRVRNPCLDEPASHMSLLLRCWMVIEE